MPSEHAQRVAAAPNPGPGTDSWGAFRKQLELYESLATQKGHAGWQVGAFAQAAWRDPLEPAAIWKAASRQGAHAAETGFSFQLPEPHSFIFPQRVAYQFGKPQHLDTGRGAAYTATHFEHLPFPFAPGSEAPAKQSGPVQFVMSLVRLWNLGDGAAARLLGFEPQDAAAASVLSGRARLTRDAKDRVANLVQIRSLLDSLFRDIGTETEWLNTPKHELNNRAPRSLLDDGTLESLLTLRYFVEHLSRL